MHKSEAKKLVERMRDYIPKGKPVAVSSLTFRRMHEHELHLCGARTGNDIQSGPYYCGAIADWVSSTSDGLAAVCERHGEQFHIKREA